MVRGQPDGQKRSGTGNNENHSDARFDDAADNAPFEEARLKSSPQLTSPYVKPLHFVAEPKEPDDSTSDDVM
ncbi:hypothetical protein [Alicyclobacillus mengziensis]|uniref:Uncharacterized protein n=1 Tax=Alicyclobacillus mengziensis TaxID=2931921 RepID=A0A9X7VXK1_9BACL|nr:hypothetical protein [Alicyclobacillus mengziensis]QSO46410.1 hypothetical protein JZ786_18285 [Alicyclobacillus mengziensis]